MSTDASTDASTSTTTYIETGQRYRGWLPASEIASLIQADIEAALDEATLADHIVHRGRVRPIGYHVVADMYDGGQTVTVAVSGLTESAAFEVVSIPGSEPRRQHRVQIEGIVRRLRAIGGAYNRERVGPGEEFEVDYYLAVVVLTS